MWFIQILKLFVLFNLALLSCRSGSQDQENLTASANRISESRKEQGDILDKATPPRAKLISESAVGWKILKRRLGQDDWIDVSFVNADTGWIVSIKGDNLVPLGGNVFRTANGGKSWERVPLRLPDNSFISHIWLFDESRALVLIQTLGGEITKLQILETSNAGKTWKPGFSAAKTIASKIRFNDKGEGWVTGIRAEARYSYDRANVLLRTRDFGKSWEDVTPHSAIGDKNETISISPSGGDELADIYFDKGSSVFLLLKGGKVLYSSDSGDSWTIRSTIYLNREHSEGFSKLLETNDSSFVAMSGSNVPEGVWSSFTSFAGTEAKESTLAGTFLKDMDVSRSGEIVTCGLYNDFSGGPDGVIVVTKDLINWSLLHKESGDCKLGCSFNKMAKQGENGFIFVGSDGVILKASRAK